MLWLSLAVAAESGIVVSFATGDLPVQDEVVVLLVSEEGTTEVALADDGEMPDVAAGDHSWAGAVAAAGDAFSLTLLVDGEEKASGDVEFPDDGPRDLRLAWNDGDLEIQVTPPPAAPGVGEGQPLPPGEGPSGTPTAPADPSQGGDPIEGVGGPGQASAPNGPPNAPATLPSGDAGDDSALLIGLGLGLLVLAGLVLAWMRSGAGTGYRLKTKAELQPEPPLLGPGGPVLSEGFHAVKVSGDAAELAAALLPVLARDHRVLVVGLDQVGPVWGGPVYRCTAQKAVHVGDTAEDLLEGPGMPLVVLAVGGEGLDEQLPDGVGGLWLGEEGELEATRTEQGWTLAGHPVA